jgi:hypothetical protein
MRPGASCALPPAFGGNCLLKLARFVSFGFWDPDAGGCGVEDFPLGFASLCGRFGCLFSAPGRGPGAPACEAPLVDGFQTRPAGSASPGLRLLGASFGGLGALGCGAGGASWPFRFRSCIPLGPTGLGVYPASLASLDGPEAGFGWVAGFFWSLPLGFLSPDWVPSFAGAS